MSVRIPIALEAFPGALTKLVKRRWTCSHSIEIEPPIQKLSPQYRNYPHSTEIVPPVHKLSPQYRNYPRSTEIAPTGQKLFPQYRNHPHSTEIVPRNTEIDPAVQNTVQSTVQSTIQSTVQVPLPTEVVRLPTRNTYLRISWKLAENPFQPCRAPPRKSPLAAPAAFHRWPPTKKIGKISMRPVQVNWRFCL